MISKAVYVEYTLSPPVMAISYWVSYRRIFISAMVFVCLVKNLLIMLIRTYPCEVRVDSIIVQTQVRKPNWILKMYLICLIYVLFLMLIYYLVPGYKYQVRAFWFMYDFVM